MITVHRKNWVYKYDGKLATLEDTNNKYMYFPNKLETIECNKSNVYIDYLINIITNL
jgi:hypothetical protein